MTCAHVVDVALKKVTGVDTVEVSLNKGLATVKLKPGNAVTVQQFWQLLREKGYTPKATTVSVKGELSNAHGRLELNVGGTRDVLALVEDSKDPGAYGQAMGKLGQTVVLHGVMTPGKDLKSAVPLRVDQTK